MHIFVGGAALIAGIAITATVFIIALRAENARRKKRKGQHEQAGKKRRMEFSKILAVWAAIIATTTAAASFVLAVYDKQTVADLSITIFTACIGYLVTYASKSAYEKNSRNKHRLDENGLPFEDQKNNMNGG